MVIKIPKTTLDHKIFDGLGIGWCECSLSYWRYYFYPPVNYLWNIPGICRALHKATDSILDYPHIGLMPDSTIMLF